MPNAPEATPIFDAVMAAQGHEMMPFPPLRTHEEFMADHGQAEFLDRAEKILTGELPAAPKTPKKGAARGRSVPVKKK